MNQRSIGNLLGLLSMRYAPAIHPSECFALQWKKLPSYARMTRRRIFKSPSSIPLHSLQQYKRPILLVGEDLPWHIKRSGAKNVDQLLMWVERRHLSEVERCERQKKPIDLINDWTECMMTLCEGRYEIAEVIAAIDDLFPKKAPERIVLLSSTHRAKGKEWDTVYVLEDTFFIRRGNPREERNLIYVARTRAINNLINVKGR